MGRRALKYFLLQQKFYFDTGLSVIGYAKYIIVAFGLSFKNPTLTAYVAIISAFMCYFLGMIWCKNEFATISQDIANQYNPFVASTLKHLSKTKKFK